MKNLLLLCVLLCGTIYAQAPFKDGAECIDYTWKSSHNCCHITAVSFKNSYVVSWIDNKKRTAVVKIVKSSGVNKNDELIILVIEQVYGYTCPC